MRRPRPRPPATVSSSRVRLLRCATRTSSSRSFYREASKARGTWRANSASAGYSSAAGAQATAPGSGPGSVRARNWPVPAAHWTGDGTPCRVTPNAQRSMPQSNSCGRCSTARTSTAPAPSSSSGPTSPCRRRRGSPRSIPCSATSTTCSAIPSVRRRWPAAEPLAVRARRGTTAAHYEYDGDLATIAVPDRHTTWALRELVVLHEIAHHLCQDRAGARAGVRRRVLRADRNGDGRRGRTRAARRLREGGRAVAVHG